MSDSPPTGSSRNGTGLLPERFMEAMCTPGVFCEGPDGFDRWALLAYEHQFRENYPFGAYCRARDATPEHVRSWVDVPPVPVAAFKALDLVCGSPDDSELVFRTSGTTEGPGLRGRHIVRSAEIYRRALLPPFRRYVLEGMSARRFVSLVPSPVELPDSSLSFMIGTVAEREGTRVHWVVDRAGAVDGDEIARAVREAGAADEAVVLIGTAFSLVHALERDPCPLPTLPPGSRIMETGGFKGRAREVSKKELYRWLTEQTGVARAGIVNEYGMTELLSQLYEPVVREGAEAGGWHVPPPWMRVRALDPVDLDPLPEGEEGLLAFFDLANLESVCHVLTEDVGAVRDGRVRLLGRYPGAEPRGCSRAMDALMSAAG